MLLRSSSAPVVKAGYGCSPIAFGDTIICSVGGPGQSVMSFRQHDGAVVWKSGDFLTSQAPPILIEVAGRPQLVIVGGGTVNGLDPAMGNVLWSDPHDPGNDLNCSTPLWGPDNILVVSSAYKAGTRALRLNQNGDATMPEELWFTQRVRFMFLNAIRLGDYVYGTSGDFGPAFLTAVDVKTGEAAWQSAASGARASSTRTARPSSSTKTALTSRMLSPEGVTVLARSSCSKRRRGAPPHSSARLSTRETARRSSRSIWERDSAGRFAWLVEVRETGRLVDGGILVLAPTVLLCQTPDFAGTWRLDQARSRVSLEATLAGLIGAGAPATLHVTQPTNGTLVVESQINESHARLYVPGRRHDNARISGRGRHITMTTRWEGQTLVNEGTRESPSGTSTPVKEVFASTPMDRPSKSRSRFRLPTARARAR